MSHLPVLPVLVPLLAAVVLLFLSRGGATAQRTGSLIAIGINLTVAVLLVDRAAGGTVDVYALGNWQPPFGIVLVTDRLSSMMVLVTALAGLLALLSLSGGKDALGLHFHPLFQLQIAGLNGAFLTGDLFNLFVFFEVMLIASYGLLVHGGGAARARGGLHYVVVNLVGSTLFLFALALIYGTLGTLNLADVAGRLATVPESDQSIVIVGLTLLMVVFAIKAAIAPLSLWLPRAYPVALPAVGALFAVMTKVGIYAMVRVSTAAFESAPYMAGLLESWLFPFAIASIALGVFGLFASTRLGEVAAHLVLISSGTLAAALAIGGERMISAIVFYLPHTVLCTSALFLVIGAISQRRGACEDRLERGAPLAGLTALGLIFLISAVALSGLPPLSGFLGKWILMNGAVPSLSMYVFWAALILSGFASALVLARSGSRVFWEPLPDTPAVATTPHRNEQTAVLLSAAIVVAVTVLAQPIDQYARATAAQLRESSIYQRAVLPDPQTIVREGRP